MRTLYDFLSANPVWLVAVALLFGLLIGSFLNVVIHRLPIMLQRGWEQDCARLTGGSVQEGARYNLLMPPSHCPACLRLVKPWQNLPLISFVLLRGRCAACEMPISRRYPLVELATGLVFALMAWQLGPGSELAGAILLTAALIALAFIDADTQLLPDCLTLPLLWAGLLFNLVTGLVPLADAVLGAVFGYLALWLVYWAFRLATGKEGMGYGDFKLLAALGAWLGWQALPLVILLSSLVGALIGIALIMVHRAGRNQALPFGPYLAAAGWIAFLWGDRIMTWYLHG
ncbi:A24 family peptidase [Crenobacter sp. SG2305]|uniref:prepilin peptidase n=1 Tax=Crenobacter oryzisoli TaxID=3056844 RepID=UPI0025AAB144|nr:A24 family peptidase [Crenobacter sp. SG2305]MDN0082168.1 A24 family peptidase [Crenobacter sp. SG2305]